ncbi:hypothetical protein [Aeribacillus pallidus]|uniref:Uncharacterized protein n=1 Tax=Aeribacillus pallidus TaxID=33936 RepID=A0A223E6U0_9BACI|nr:hypothetical protein [Aeribacillus pallidus]ASS90974.1 hypothetical protein AP3564_12760 [Aeribacillus pallidus]
MGGTPNGLKQFLLQGRTTIKENVFQNCLRSYPLWEGMMDFHAWVGSKITHGCFYGKTELFNSRLGGSEAGFFLIQAPENNFFAFIYGQYGKINMRN